MFIVKEYAERFIDAHAFFCRESRLFVGRPKYPWCAEFVTSGEDARLDMASHYEYTFKQILRWPIAYIKFVRLSMKVPST